MNHINLPTQESTYSKQVENNWQYKSAELLTLSKKEVHHRIVTLLEDRLRRHLSWSLDIVRVRGDAETSFSDLNTIVPDIWVETLSNNPVSDQQIVETCLVVSIIDHVEDEEKKQILGKCLGIKGLRELVLINTNKLSIQVLRKSEEFWILSSYDEKSIVPIEIVDMHLNAYEIWVNDSESSIKSNENLDKESEFSSLPYEGDRFLYRSKLNHMESGRGYLIKIAEELDYKSPQWITSCVGENINAINNETVLNKLAPVLRYSPSELKKHFYLNVGGSGMNGLRSFFGKTVPMKFLNFSTPRICPLCIIEHGHIKGYWDINLVTACPEHNCELIDTCPDCYKPLTWNRSSISKCNCGFSFSNIKGIPASKNILNMTKVIYQVADQSGNFVDVVSKFGFSQEILNLSLQNLLKLTNYVGLKFRQKRDKEKNIAARRNVMRHRFDVVETAGMVLSEWPNNYLEQLYITNITYQVKTTVNQQVIINFRRFYKDLIKDFSDPEFNFLRDTFEEYLNRYWETLFSAFLFSNGVNIHPNWVISEQLSMLIEQKGMNNYRKIYDKDKIIGLGGVVEATGQVDIWLDKNCIQIWIIEHIKSNSRGSINKDSDSKLGLILNTLIRLNDEHEVK